MAGQERRRIGGSTRSWRRHATGAGILAQRPAPRGGASAVGEALRELKVMLTNVIGRNTEARLGDPYPKQLELENCEKESRKRLKSLTLLYGM